MSVGRSGSAALPPAGRPWGWCRQVDAGTSGFTPHLLTCLPLLLPSTAPTATLLSDALFTTSPSGYRLRGVSTECSQLVLRPGGRPAMLPAGSQLQTQPQRPPVTCSVSPWLLVYWGRPPVASPPGYWYIGGVLL